MSAALGEAFAPGVLKRLQAGADAYFGTAEALEAAGLLTREQLPGAPGMRKITVTVYADGTIPPSRVPSTTLAREQGAKQIKRAARGTYCVRIMVSRNEWIRRIDARDALNAARDASETGGDAALRACAGRYYAEHGVLPSWAPKTRRGTPMPSHLRLVWPAPAA